jgi:hypothetical protein
VERCGVIRGIREIRGYDQPVGRSPGEVLPVGLTQIRLEFDTGIR